MKILVIIFIALSSTFAQAKDYFYSLPLSSEGEPAQQLVAQEKNLTASSNRFIFYFIPASDGYFQAKDQGYHFDGKPHAAIFDVTDSAKHTTVADNVTWVMNQPVQVFQNRRYALVITQKENKEKTGFILLWGAFSDNKVLTDRLNVHTLCDASGDGNIRQVWVSKFEIGNVASSKPAEYFAVDLFFMGRSDSVYLCGTKYTNFGSGSCWSEYPRTGGEVRTCDFSEIKMTTTFSQVRSDSGYLECTLNGRVTKRLEYFNCKPFVRGFNFYGDPSL